jgi:hypothetical protein
MTHDKTMSGIQAMVGKRAEITCRSRAPFVGVIKAVDKAGFLDFRGFPGFLSALDVVARRLGE